MPLVILWVERIMLPGRPCDGEGQISAYLLSLCHFCEHRKIMLKWCCLMKDFYG